MANLSAAVPCLWLGSIHYKERMFIYDSGPRRTFEQNLDFYPVTRRAWNRALAIRDAEMAELKNKVSHEG